ncbi:MAG: SdrD B-like domain-containing protein [Chloroflexota bacterium]
MRSIKMISLLMALAVMAAVTLPLTVSASPAEAPLAQTNLLKNAGFEEGFTGGVANSWAKWTISDAAATPQTNCGRKEPTFQQISSSLDARRVKDGSSAQQILTPVQDPGFGFYGGLQQTVTGLTAGKTYRFSVWAHAWSSTKDNPALSEGTGPAYFEVGIGQGSTYAADPGIKHSGIKDIKDNYVQLSVEAVATGNTITVFTYANPSACSKHNEAFFDAASLTEVGGAGATATTAPGVTAKPPTSTLRVLATKFPTPTPNAEGKIIYTVQQGDTVIDICGVIGRGSDITCIDDILKMNGMSDPRSIFVGQQLIIGTTGAPVQPTTAPTVAASPEPPTAVPNTQPATDPNAQPTASQPTPVGAGEGSICVTLYNDANGNGILDAGEGLVAGGTFSLLDLTASTTLQTYTTDGASEPHCFEGLPSGNYRITSSLPAGFKATTRADWDLNLLAASRATLDFGAQSTGEATSGNGSGGGTSGDSGRLTQALLAGAGVILLLIAAGVAGFLVLTRRR